MFALVVCCLLSVVCCLLQNNKIFKPAPSHSCPRYGRGLAGDSPGDNLTILQFDMQTQKSGENPMKKTLYWTFFFPIQFVDILRDLLTIFLLHGRHRAG